jgi:signal transduction histidine kinase
MLTDKTTDALFLTRVCKQLVSSLEYRQTLDNIARAALPDIADWAIVDVVDEYASIQSVAAAHVDPNVDGGRVQGDRPVVTDAVARAMLSGRAELVCLADEPMAVESGTSSVIIAPLIKDNRVLGALTLGAGRDYSSADLPLVEELAECCAQALDNAQRFRLANESIEVRDAFVATISHDLKNPLATIAAQAQLLRRLTASSEPNLEAIERLRRGIKRIERTTERMSRMIDALLDLARLELGGRLELERAPVDLVEVARRVIDEQQESSSRHTIQLAGETSLVGNWDAARLERVLDNLVGNAVKYSPDGGLVTVVCVRDVEDVESSAIVSVRDHGMGIPADELDRIFERFHRANNVAGISGTGIGLAMVREVVTRHGGTITVESSEGTGSTFTIRLPLE